MACIVYEVICTVGQMYGQVCHMNWGPHSYANQCAFAGGQTDRRPCLALFEATLYNNALATNALDLRRSVSI